MSGKRRERGFLPFRVVNRHDQPDHDPGLQRHHLLPLQLLARTSFERMFAQLGDRRERFEDFRENGLLLPCREAAARRLGMPLHRGPHRHYSELVIERVGQIESAWSQVRLRDEGAAACEARMRLALLQRALRRFLLDSRRRIVLNRADPWREDSAFVELDAMVDALWGSTD